jgi:hypothetical protein
MAYKFDDKIRSSLREDRDTPSHNGVPETLVCVERSRAKDQGPEVRGLAQRGILRSDTYRIHALSYRWVVNDQIRHHCHQRAYPLEPAVLSPQVWRPRSRP